MTAQYDMKDVPCLDEETGIETIDNEQLTIDNAMIYDLSGRKILNDSAKSGNLHRGLYLIGGKKYIKR